MSYLIIHRRTRCARPSSSLMKLMVWLQSGPVVRIRYTGKQHRLWNFGDGKLDLKILCVWGGKKKTHNFLFPKFHRVHPAGADGRIRLQRGGRCHRSDKPTGLDWSRAEKAGALWQRVPLWPSRQMGEKTKKLTGWYLGLLLIVFCFFLRQARKDILKIHTRQWTPPPSDAFLEELADKCVGAFVV